MEDYDQSFGYIVYRISHKKFKHLKLPSKYIILFNYIMLIYLSYLTEGVSDRGVIMIDNKVKAVVQSNSDFELNVTDSDFDKTLTDHRVDILVENIGRKNIGDMNGQRKGLNSDVIIDDQKINKYEVYTLDFTTYFAQKAKAAKGRPYQSGHKQQSPTLYRAVLEIKGQPKDTFIRTDNWTKGIVLINDFNIGRYYDAGPQKALYLPAPLLKTGKNDILIFELHSSSDKIKSVAESDLG